MSIELKLCKACCSDGSRMPKDGSLYFFCMGCDQYVDYRAPGASTPAYTGAEEALEDWELEKRAARAEREQEARGFLSDPDYRASARSSTTPQALQGKVAPTTIGAPKAKPGTQKAILEELKGLLGSEIDYATEAMIRIFDQQTLHEKDAQMAQDNNGVGFTKFDAELLTSFSKQFKAKGWLSPKQQAVVLKRIPKYAGQILKLNKGKNGPTNPRYADELLDNDVRFGTEGD